MTTASISVGEAAPVQYVLRLGDACLVHAQRLAEWCGHAPVIEEDIALTNMSLDLIGQARALLTHAARLDGRGHDEDQLAFLRDERDYRNPTLAELPIGGPTGSSGRGDFAFTVLRSLFMSTWQKLWWQQLAGSSDAELAAIAGKALKEARYHQQHAADWVVRLGDGTDESARRLRAALDAAWPYVAELFEDDDIDAQASAAGLGPKPSALREAWQRDIDTVFAEAGLTVPKTGAFRSHGRQGRHSEHMGFLLAQMQYLQRTYPGGAW